VPICSYTNICCTSVSQTRSWRLINSAHLELILSDPSNCLNWWAYELNKLYLIRNSLKMCSVGVPPGTGWGNYSTTAKKNVFADWEHVFLLCCLINNTYSPTSVVIFKNTSFNGSEWTESAETIRVIRILLTH